MTEKQSEECDTMVESEVSTKKCCTDNGKGTVRLEEARKCLEEEQQRRTQAFNEEFAELCEKYGVALEVESRIVVVPRG